MNFIFFKINIDRICNDKYLVNCYEINCSLKEISCYIECYKCCSKNFSYIDVNTCLLQLCKELGEKFISYKFNVASVNDYHLGIGNYICAANVVISYNLIDDDCNR